MTLYLIAANAVATLGVDDPVVAAADLGALRSASDALARAEALRAGFDTVTAAASEQARAEGHADGHAAGLAAAAGEVRAQLFDLAQRAVSERAAVRSDVTRLALEVVRRIAGELGDSALVAGLAERATADLLPDEAVTVRVSPTAAAAVGERFHDRAAVTVVGDAALGDGDCLVETPLGISHAGLEIQLAAVERAWSDAPIETAVDDAR